MKIEVLAASAVSMLLGLSVMVGWHTHVIPLIQIHPSFVPMQYNTALGFLLSGLMLGLLGVLPRVVMTCAALVTTIGILTLLEYTIGADLGIDQLLMQHDITIKTSHPGRMAPNTAICFTLAGIAILISNGLMHRWTALITGILGSLVLGLSLVAALGYVMGIEGTYGWGSLTRMAMHTAVGFIVVGLGLLMCAWMEKPARQDDSPFQASIPMGIVVLAVTISLWQALQPEENVQIARDLVLFFGIALAAMLAWAVNRSQATQNLLYQQQLTKTLVAAAHEAERTYIDQQDIVTTCDFLIDRLLSLTESEFGFIGEIMKTAEDVPYLKTHAITNIAWDEDTRALYENVAPNLEFHNLDTLFGEVLRTGRPVISNNPKDDPRRGGLPDGHPPLHAFLGLPFHHANRFVGMVGIANRVKGYDESLIKALQPFTDACATVFNAHHEREIRLKIEVELQTAHDELEHRVEERTAELTQSNTRLQQEVAERQQVEDALRDAEIRNHTLLDGSPVCNKIIDLDCRLLYMSAAGIKQLKISDTSSLHGSAFPPSFFPESTRIFLLDHLERAKAGEISDQEYPAHDTEGGVVWYHATFVPARDEDGRIKYIIVTSVDITERKRAEDKLHNNLIQFKSLVDTTPEAIISIDHTQNIINFNPAARDIFGYTPEEARGQPLTMLLPEAERAAHPQHVAIFASSPDDARQMGERREIYGQRKSGEIFSAEASISKMQLNGQWIFTAILREITERKQLEAQVRQTHKMEAIGQLAGGIAHDFNNILSAIFGYSELIKNDAPLDSELQQNVGQVLNAATRATGLVKQILTFSRQGADDSKPIAVGPIIMEVLSFLRASLPSTVEIRSMIDPAFGPILADPTQIHQVVMNLCTNAEHAMREHGGVLDIDVREITLDAAFATRHGVSKGRYVRVRIRDTGRGMRQEVIEHIFEPFFTTKTQGEGTGLGLSVIHGIVKRYEGVITVESEVGQGTTFDVHFPLIEESMGSVEQPLSAAVLGGTERILYVDDESVLVKMYQTMLENVGYRMVVRTNAIEALELFRNSPNAFDIVVTDQTMPQMTGIELAKECIATRPDIPVLLCTGFSHAINLERIKAMGIRALVMKPVVLGELTQAIRGALD